MGGIWVELASRVFGAIKDFDFAAHLLSDVDSCGFCSMSGAVESSGYQQGGEACDHGEFTLHNDNESTGTLGLIPVILN